MILCHQNLDFVNPGVRTVSNFFTFTHICREMLTLYPAVIKDNTSRLTQNTVQYNIERIGFRLTLFLPIIKSSHITILGIGSGHLYKKFQDLPLQDSVVKVIKQNITYFCCRQLYHFACQCSASVSPIPDVQLQSKAIILIDFSMRKTFSESNK